jgi:hypothetical protein
MLTDLEKLEKKFNSRHEAAKALGITERHFRRIKQTGKATKTLFLLVKEILFRNSNDPG